MTALVADPTTWPSNPSFLKNWQGTRNVIVAYASLWPRKRTFKVGHNVDLWLS